MPAAPVFLICLIVSSSLGLGAAFPDATSLLQAKATEQLGAGQASETYSEAYMQMIADRESAEALELAFKTLEKMGQNISRYGQTSNLSIKHVRAEPAPGDEGRLKWLDYTMQVTPIIGVRPMTGNIGPYFELRIPKLGCNLQGAGAATWGDYFADKLRKCFYQYDSAKTKIQLFIGMRTKAGDLIYIPIDANSKMAEVGIAWWTNTGWGGLTGNDLSKRRNPPELKPWDPKYFVYTGLFHQHVIGIDGSVVPKIFDRDDDDVKGANIELVGRDTHLWTSAKNWSHVPDWMGAIIGDFSLPGGVGDHGVGDEGEKKGFGSPYFFEFNFGPDGPGFELKGSLHYQKPCSWFTSNEGVFACPGRCHWHGGACAAPPDPNAGARVQPAGGFVGQRFGADI